MKRRGTEREEACQLDSLQPKYITLYHILLYYVVLYNFFFGHHFLSLKRVFFFLFFMAALGLRCCARAFSSCGERGLLFVVVRGLLIAVASLVAEHGL